MAYAAPSTHPTGYIVTSTDWAIQVNNDKFFHGVPTARVVRTSVQSITNNTWTAISFSSKDWDSNNMFATTGTKVTCKTAGKFLVCFTGVFANSSLGSLRGIAIQKNTTTAGTGHEAQMIVASTAITAASGRLSLSQLVALTTGQFIRGEVLQDSGGGLNTSTGGSGVSVPRPTFSAIWMSS